MNAATRHALAEAHRDAIRSGRARCIPGVCRHGFPDVYHPPECLHNYAVEAIYRIERESEADSDRNGETR